MNKCEYGIFRLPDGYETPFPRSVIQVTADGIIINPKRRTWLEVLLGILTNLSAARR